jgi:transcriptional regulator with XRE-family HTH domain
MQPEQMRAARAALNWSLERLAEASGVHRNTISNFETRRYVGEPEKLAAVKRALEDAGAIFIEENGDAAGAGLRRFRLGDLVRFRPQTRLRGDDVAANEVGKIVGVEPHPPQTGPTYKIEVQFERVLMPYTFRYEYELVKAAPDTEELTPPDTRNGTTISDPKAIIDEFCIFCEWAWIDRCLYVSLMETDQNTLELYTSIAPHFFEDLKRILREHLVIQYCKITDPAKTGKKPNLTTNYILEELPWPDAVGQQLREINDRLKGFRQHIEAGRSKRIVHIDFSAQTERLDNLGDFPEGADRQFLEDLQTFINIASGHYHNGKARPIDVAMPTDTHQLVKALKKSVVFDQCTRCDPGQRAVAVLDYEAHT